MDLDTEEESRATSVLGMRLFSPCDGTKLHKHILASLHKYMITIETNKVHTRQLW